MSVASVVTAVNHRAHSEQCGRVIENIVLFVFVVFALRWAITAFSNSILFVGIVWVSGIADVGLLPSGGLRVRLMVLRGS